MTKREKYPPLKSWQLEVVKKHETRNRLLKGSPFDRAKYRYMQLNQLREEEFDCNEEQFTRSIDFTRMYLRERLTSGINGLANFLRGVLNGQRKK